MALATTCPQCNTSFKVVPDQLKLRRGLVRCGACQHVFSGIDYLRYVDESQAGAADKAAAHHHSDEDLHTALFLPETLLASPPEADEPVNAQAEAANAPAEPFIEPTIEADQAASESEPTSSTPTSPGIDNEIYLDIPTFVQTLTAGNIEHQQEHQQEQEHEHAGEVEHEHAVRTAADQYAAHPLPDPIESLTATTPAGFGHTGLPLDMHAAARTATHVAPASAAAARSPVPDTAAGEDEESVIDYFSTGRRRRGFMNRHRPLALSAALILALMLATQWVIGQRAMIAARVPALKPLMSAVLSPFGLRVGVPRDLAALTIESFELQASATPGVLAMSAVLRNHADYSVQWPSLELTLTDPGERVLVRKVLGPDDYLRETHADGLPPRAERPLRLALEASELQPAGYSVALFYP